MEQQRARTEPPATPAPRQVLAPPTPTTPPQRPPSSPTRASRPVPPRGPAERPGAETPALADRIPRRPRPAEGTKSGTGAPTRFTAVGIGVITCVITLAGGVLDALVLDGPGALFGLCFLGACFFAATRVRSSDLVAAPICAPIAFAVTLLLTVPGDGDGITGQLIGVATSLAVHAGWLYGGTFIAGGLALTRHFALRNAPGPGSGSGGRAPGNRPEA
ncbi:DUF6542 domain-containing protein [Wenjunlia tyrosinilytica]|uniref:DUF6542 domain-containing protein n=1 Tax=Wenjunlia tyrosinilytica TaxID=1544741 RepID=UPI00166A202C|nr:DUF6542 domain-containing protein [Wenjunlia tyrosinilytica]